MTDLFDVPGLRPPHDDARVDITDIYAFRSPENPEASVFMMCVNPLAPTMADGFHPGAAYDMQLDVSDDGVPDMLFQITFSQKRDGRQSADVALLATESGEAIIADEDETDLVAGRSSYEEMLFEQVPASFGAEAEIHQQGEYRFFCGMRSDPAFFDLEGYRNGMRFTGTDFFADKNVYAIVLQVPNSLFERQPVEFWCRVTSAGEQLDRMGKPLTKLLFLPDGAKDAFAMADPLDDVQEFSDQVIRRLLTSGSGYTEHEADQLADQVLPDVLTYDCTNRFGYPNGRQLADEVVDEQLAILTKNTAPDQGLRPHEDLMEQFPYLGPPHPVSMPRQRTGEQSADRTSSRRS